MMSARLLILGLDGATWDVLTPLTAQGVMPNLRRLMQESALLELNSTQPFITPVAWASFQTGCDPHEHGILDYRAFDHRQRQLVLNNTTNLRGEGLLQTISAAGGDVVSLNLPMTWPVPAGVRGLVVGGLESPSIEAALTPYPQFAQRLRASGAAFDLKTIWKRVPRSFEELSARVAQTTIDFRGRAAAARIADEMIDWRLMFVQFQTLDAMQHRAWHLLESGCATSVAKLHEAFHALDQAVGDLAELAHHRGAELVVVSDHGFGSFRGKISLPQLLAQRGLLMPAGTANRLGHRFARARWKGRKWLWRRSRPTASTAAFPRPLSMLLPIDWRKSRAIALHGDLAGLVYLNTPERFSNGPLTTPRLMDEALAETQAALREARHPETGELLFVDVYSTAERLQIDVLDQNWPDVIAIPADGLQTRTRLVGRDRLITGDRELTGTHRLKGILILPGSLSGKVPRQAEMRDVAPTLLDLLGINAPASMSGRSLIAGGPTPLRRIDGPEPLRSPTTSELSTAEQAIVEGRLRDLGYLD